MQPMSKYISEDDNKLERVKTGDFSDDESGGGDQLSSHRGSRGTVRTIIV